MEARPISSPLAALLLPALLAVSAIANGANPAPARPAGSVTPSGDSIPANLLRLELRLDQPLPPPLEMRYVHLLDASGRSIDDALLDIALPSQDERGYTILMHPGRVKSGVGANLALGPALRENEEVSLLIDDPRLRRPLRKTWRVSAPLRLPIATGQWRLEAPAPGGRQALTLRLAAPLNAGAAQMIAIAGDDGRRVGGRAWLEAGESVWRFAPATPWRAGGYAVRVHPDIEDPAGNRLCSAFEQAGQSARRCDSEARISFTVAAPSPVAP